MTPTKAQLQILRALSAHRDARINHNLRICGTGRPNWDTRTTPGIVREMVQAGYLTYCIHRNQATGESENEWRMTAMGLGAYRQAVEAQPDMKLARRRPNTSGQITRRQFEILALLCSSNKVVILPNGNLRGAKPIPGIDNDERVCPKLSLDMQSLGLLERAPGGLRLPMLRASVKGIEALAEHINADRRAKAVCICGKTKDEHTDLSHIFTDTLDVKVVDFIEAMLKERENAEQTA